MAVVTARSEPRRALAAWASVAIWVCAGGAIPAWSQPQPDQREAAQTPAPARSPARLPSLPLPELLPLPDTPPPAPRPGSSEDVKRYEPEALCQGSGAPDRDEDATAIVPEEPPISWRAWTVGGPLPETEQATLQDFLAAEMRRRQNLTREARCELQSFIRDKLGYHLSGILVKPLEDGGRLAVLEIERLTLVRHIEVEVEDQSPILDLVRLEWRELLSTIFETEILRRLRLRPGAALASAPAACRLQLRREEERVRTYLQRVGYPESVVQIQGNERKDVCTESRPAAVRLVVHVRKGPPYRIGDIGVEGATAVAPGTVRSNFQRGRYCAPDWWPSVGGRCLIERFSQDELNNTLQRVIELYQSRGYPAVRVRTDLDFRYSDNFKPKTKTVDFTVIVNERRRIDVVFEGNDPDRFPEERLRALLTFQDEGSYDDVEVSASADAVRRYYQTQGYFEAQVTYERVNLGDFDRIVFTIHPGPRLNVEDVQVAGNRAIAGDELMAVLRTRSGAPVTAATLSRDVARMVALYRERGYHHADVEISISRALPEVGNAAVLAALVAGGAAVVGDAQGSDPAPAPAVEGDGAPSALPSGLYVRFDIREGSQTRIEGIELDFRGPHRYQAEELTGLLRFQPGDPYVQERVERGRDRIGRFYFENAHPRAAVRRCVRPGEQGQGVTVVYQVEEREPVRFGKVLLHGNFKTRDWVILSELNYREGEPLTLGRAEEGQQSLRASGLFNAVQVRFVNLDDGAEPDVNVVVEVQERHDYWFGLEGALVYSSDDGLLVESALRSPNVLGQGLQLGTRAQAQLSGLQQPRPRTLEGTFVVPHWYTRRITRPLFRLFTGSDVQAAPRLETSAFWRRDDTPRFGELTSYGFSTAVSAVGQRGFWQGWLLSLRYDFRRRSLEENLVRNPGSSDDLERSPVDVRTGALGPQLVIDKRRDASGRPNPLTPEAGFKLELRALYASPYLGGQSAFFKLGASGQHFWKLGSRVLLSNGVRYDHGIPLGASLLPETERYFAGGDTTVRGFEEDHLATEIIEEPVPPLGQLTRIRTRPAGGNIRFIHNLDLQMRLWELFDVPVASAIFLDSGLVTNSLDKVELTDLRHALGVALLRLVAPFGSLSVEYAVPLDPEIGDNPRGRYHVNFGLLF